mmetsp:Transcript_10705/g.29547  ORF Transcript_10705/g.29547 Transcript_10705/m.29547 type:complete len:361 (-) Transcript_10705:272-1354(-)
MMFGGMKIATIATHLTFGWILGSSNSNDNGGSSESDFFFPQARKMMESIMPPFPNGDNNNGDSGDNRKFVSSPIRDNFYQSSSYYASTFALITTTDESGETNIGPYQLAFPLEVCGPIKTLMLVSRPDANTIRNLKRTKKCSLNYIELPPSFAFDNELVDTIVNLGYPGQTTQEKMKDNNCFDLASSPTTSHDDIPQIISNAFQVYECTWLEDRNVAAALEPEPNRGPSEHMILRLDNILLQQQWKGNLEDDGGRIMPRLPITLGFRGGRKFWFARLQTPFFRLIPQNKGPKYEAIMYEANRMDPDVTFTKEACEQLLGIPSIFLRPALTGIIQQAKANDVSEIDIEFVLKINEERSAKT